MRKVIYSKHIEKTRKKPKSGETKVYFELEEQGEALFHQLGVDYHEFDCGPGIFTTAIIELENGQIKNIPVEHIRFITD